MSEADKVDHTHTNLLVPTECGSQLVVVTVVTMLLASAWPSRTCSVHSSWEHYLIIPYISVNTACSVRLATTLFILAWLATSCLNTDHYCPFSVFSTSWIIQVLYYILQSVLSRDVHGPRSGLGLKFSQGWNYSENLSILAILGNTFENFTGILM